MFNITLDDLTIQQFYGYARQIKRGDFAHLALACLGIDNNDNRIADGQGFARHIFKCITV